MNEIITIFTPTYNRGYILENLYTSLIKQSVRCFKWLIVDDGSNDQTKQLVEKWINEDIIPIRYHYQKNSGKMAAHNAGVDLCDTELFLCVDSDDYLTVDAIKQLVTLWENEKNDDIAGIISFRKTFKNGIQIHYPLINTKVKKTTLWDLYHKYFYQGETALAYRTNILKKFPFPIITGEKFISEAYIYFQIDDYYPMILLQNETVVCNYRNDGYSLNINKILRKNPIGFSLFFNDLVKRENSLRSKAGYSTLFIICSLLNQEHPLQILKKANNKIISFLIYPYALFKFLKFKHDENYTIYR